MYKIVMPEGAKFIIERLQANGFDAYIVGGCVRDIFLRRIPKDWDISTSASPEEAKRLFVAENYRVIETGIKHGTVTVVIDGVPYEVTTFRKDGDYTDHRHPDSVSYTTDLIEDLSRRDFTVNAMAYNDEKGLIDPFHGRGDLRNGLIQCVGNPDDRFIEDGLRILRALRFASVYGFSISESTSTAIHEHVELLDYISAERIRDELCKLLCGENVLEVLLEYKDVFSQIIPELAPCIGFEQNNRFHRFTVYDHIAHAVHYSAKNPTIRMALLLHDIGKPSCYTEDERGGHFYGHPKVSYEYAEAILTRLRFDNQTKNAILELIQYHDATIGPTKKTVKRWLNKIGEERFVQLIGIGCSDTLAHSSENRDERFHRWLQLMNIFTDVIIENGCFSMKDLKVNGKDILALGVPQGKQIGQTLDHLLDAVISDKIPNEYEALMAEAREFLS